MSKWMLLETQGYCTREHSFSHNGNRYHPMPVTLLLFFLIYCEIHLTCFSKVFNGIWYNHSDMQPTTSVCWNVSITPKRSLIYSSFNPNNFSLSAHTTINAFVSLDFTQMMSFCVWLISLSMKFQRIICVVACIRTSFPSTLNIPLNELSTVYLSILC